MPHTHFGRDAAEAQRFLADLKTGLSKPQKSIPSEWFYDERGSKLFEQITALPEYYPTRTETKILKSIAVGLADVAGVGAALIEYGAGASEKTRILLDKFEALEVYVPIDVSRDFLEATADTLRCDYPGLNVQPVIGSFLSELDLPSTQGRRVGFFPGSTVGNLSDEDIRTFFQRARLSLGSDAYFVLGFDLRKSEDVLERLPICEDRIPKRSTH
ncbi:MAG: L-histidine N(alpha)-methyltransferase, partial [Pseudomonadota bacterium]